MTFQFRFILDLMREFWSQSQTVSKKKITDLTHEII